MTVRVLLADDEAMIRAGLRMLLDGEPDIEVVAEAADGQQAVDLVGTAAPHVVLLDVRMPRLNGIEALERIRVQHPDVRVIILTTFDEDATLDGALRHGASGFLLKTSPPEAMLDAVRQAAAGRGTLDPNVVPRLIAQYGATPPLAAPAPELDVLTPRELDVLRLVGQGLSNAEVAARLYLGETTVKTHLGRVLDKLALRDRPQAIAFAHTSGLIRASGSAD